MKNQRSEVIASYCGAAAGQWLVKDEAGVYWYTTTAMDGWEEIPPSEVEKVRLGIEEDADRFWGRA